MIKPKLHPIIALLFVLVVAIAPAAAQTSDDATPVTTRAHAPDSSQVQLTTIATGFTRPLYLTHANDQSGRLFVVEQNGLIKIMDTTDDPDNPTVLETPFLDVSALISQNVFTDGYSERGLLGLAFHPNYAENGYFFINYTDLNGDTVVARYSVSEDDANIADPDSALTILTQAQPFSNHNGGHMTFAPDDGYLYIALGDGGSQGDPENNAQNTQNWLGKILRIDVDSATPYAIPEDNPYTTNPDLLPEIWAYGLRNPWRFSFDAATSDLYIADVGQTAWEEVNFEPADSTGGLNYGWKLLEGTHAYAVVPENAGDVVMPFTEYDHSQGISITGGYVYRGSNLPDLQGVYFFSDYGTGKIWASYRDADNVWHTNTFLSPAGLSVSSFGVDENNELYIVNYRGEIIRIDPA